MSGGAQEEHNTKRPGRGEREGGREGRTERKEGRESSGASECRIGIGGETPLSDSEGRKRWWPWQWKGGGQVPDQDIAYIT